MNIQPIEKRVQSVGDSLDVHSIFLTIQGEGPFCGVPCVFVRLAGCNLQCPGCDTEYTAGRQMMEPYQILGEINELWREHGWRRGLVVVTGGEPFRQELSQLFGVLVVNGYYIQVESNGTLPPSAWAYNKNISRREGVYIVCSPKTGKVHPDILYHACALKYVVAADAMAEDGLPSSVLGLPNAPARPPLSWQRPVYVQPMDSKDEHENTRNTKAAVDSCIRNGHTLQIQIHKVVGVE